jgi:hypothetical protein
MAECPSAAADRYNAALDAQAEEEMAAEDAEKISKKMLAKWNQATGCPHEDWADAIRCYYKYTDCGPWLKVESDRICIGSIVEGADRTTETHELIWPFKVKEVRRAMKAVEDEAQQIWNDTHGCEACGGPDEFGDVAINPKCEACKGEGTVI